MTVVIENRIYSGCTTPGYSDEAQSVGEKYKKCSQQAHQADSLSGGRNRAIDTLNSIFQECKDSNWDGFGANSIKRETLVAAQAFVDSLPKNFPIPELGVEPDGHITFEWYISSSRLLSISISPDSTLFYAGIFGNAKVSGVEYFLGKVPDQLVTLIRRVYE